MNRFVSKTISIMLSLMIITAYLPGEIAWAVSDTSNEIETEAAEESAVSVDIEEATEKADIVVDQEDDAEGNELNIEKNDTAINNDVTVDDGLTNGSVELTDTDDGYSGIAIPENGYDLATVRQIWKDPDGTEHEQYLDYTEEPDDSYSFRAERVETASIVTAYFYDLGKWDGAVDLTWYDPDQTEFEIATPAQLAGLAAITNGMVDEAVTKEFMIKDNEGRSYEDDEFTHRYISTEPALVDLLTPNNYDGAGQTGQVRDTAWRLPEAEHRKLGEDDTHNDFLYRTVRLTSDINMGDKNWTPIGGKYAMNRDATGDDDPKVIDTRFQGLFDGQGHSVTLNCDRMAKKGFAYAMEIALIGYLGGGVDYKNGYPKDTYMDYANYWVPTIKNVVVKGDIKGRRMVAGVVGRTGETNYGVLVENCVNYATVYATDMRGCAGIVGAAWGKTVIRNCYNAGTIHSTYWEHGGIVGSNGYEGSEDKPAAGANIYNCYNVGETAIYDRESDSWIYDGQEIGADGQAFSPYTVSNCYYPEPESAIEGRTGYSSGETLKNKKVRLDSVESADLTSDDILNKLNTNGDVFAKDTANINNGYPVLWFQGTSGSGTASVTLRQTEGGIISFAAFDGSVLSGLSYGTTVDFLASPEKGKRLTGYKVIAGNSEMVIPANGFYTVTGTDVTIEGIFGDRVPSTLRFIEKDDGAPYYIKVEKIYDADDGACKPPIELKSGDQTEMDDIIRITPVDIRLTKTQPDIKYLEYTGRFSDPVYPDWSLEVLDLAARTYTVTGDIEDVDITVTAKTQGKRWTSVADTTWYTPGKKTFTLTTAKQLAGLAVLCNNGNSFKGVTILLGNDINLDNNTENSGDEYGYERSWVGIGSSEHYAFKGTFNGQGHTIKYMHRNFAPGYCAGDNGGLFGVTVGALIKNVNVEGGSYINDTNNVTMECSFKNGANGGSIAGTAIDTVIENCYANVSMNNAFDAGGIVGILDGSSVIRNCVSECTISGTNESIGGIAGKIEDVSSTNSSVEISDCSNNGSIYSTKGRVGGILGNGNTGKAVVSRCINDGPVTANMTNGSSNRNAVGGIIGFSEGRITCEECINRGEITGLGKTRSQGGIAGVVLKGTITNCYNTGRVYSESSLDNAELAGIVNLESNLRVNASTVVNCYNIGEVKTADSFTSVNTGGIIGNGSATINEITNTYCTEESAAGIGGTAGKAGEVVAADELRTYGPKLAPAFVTDLDGINDGFPVLVWQDEDLIGNADMVSVTKNNDTALSASWKVAGICDGVELWRSVSQNGTYTNVYSGKASGFVNTGLIYGKTYYYKVRVFRIVDGATYYSGWSNIRSYSLIPGTPVLSSVKNKKTKTAVITWKKVIGASGYEVYRSTKKGSGYKKVATIKKGSTVRYTNKKLKKGKKYYYKIRAYKTVNKTKGYSAFSAVKSAKIKK